MVSDPDDRMTDAVAGLLAALIPAMEAFASVQRRLHPPDIPQLAGGLTPFGERLASTIEALDAIAWPDRLASDLGRLKEAAVRARETVQLMAELTPGNEVFGAYRALGRSVRCHELLYPLAQVLPSINRLYLEERVHSSPGHLERVTATSSPPRTSPPTGVLDLDNSRESRGGASLYVPEFYDPARTWPLVVALHGGSGHGADFLWTWMREARSRGFLLLAPTSRGRTWSLERPALDGDALRHEIDWIAERWNLDLDRVLLTGISDGATFGLLCGLLSDQPYTHLAPLSGVLAPLAEEQRRNAAGKPIYLVHGALDWMFPIEMARVARQRLESLGARLVYREIDDLSHTYAREENAPILEWFDPSLSLGG